MGLEVLLEHLRGITLIVGALDNSVTALALVAFQVRIRHNFGAALVSILTTSLDHSKLCLQEWMGIDNFEVRLAAARTLNLAFVYYQ